MPTGSGKTAVIATLARCLPEIGCVLVLAPRAALRDQLALDIHHRFFNHLKKAPQRRPKQVFKLPGNYTMVQLEEPGGGEKIPFRDHSKVDFPSAVFVMTDQMLDSLRRVGAGAVTARWKGDLFAALRSHVSLVLVDEGHYEPALSWSQAIRQFDVPRVLFTATPFRNDLKAFDTDYFNAYSYPFHKATEERFIRQVEIIDRPTGLGPKTFIDDVLDAYDGGSLQLIPKARVIIRCESREKILQMATALRDRGRAYVAIHERFPSTSWPNREWRSVPNRDEEPEWYEDDGPVFWIHQFKLLEGIDDSRFQLLALDDPLPNVRAFVQQVGIVLRNPHRNPTRAFVLDHSGGVHRRAWSNFEAFDQDIEARGGPLKPLGEYVFEQLSKTLPDPAYINGSFRDRFTFDSAKAGQFSRHRRGLPVGVGCGGQDGLRFDARCQVSQVTGMTGRVVPEGGGPEALPARGANRRLDDRLLLGLLA